MRQVLAAFAAASLALIGASEAQAGKVFLTGHDPDFHTQAGNGANLLKAGLNFVTNGMFDDAAPAKKFLWVESQIAIPGGHLRGESSLPIIGANAGVQYDTVNAAGFLALTAGQLSGYSAIAVASSFGGLLTRAELDALIARSSDIKAFVNAGGGLFASAECSPCAGDPVNLLGGGTPPSLFGFVPVTVTSIGANPPFNVTPYGFTTFGLTFNDLNDPTHNSFGAVGGLNIVDTDSADHATTLAGDVQIGDGVFIPTPEPASLGLFGLGLAGLAWVRRRRA